MGRSAESRPVSARLPQPPFPPPRRPPPGCSSAASFAAGCAESVSSSVALAVAAIPEGLPFVATIAELSASKRLARHNILVRNPRAMEALGRVDTVCFDKTGTLTEGRIQLRVVSDGRSHENCGQRRTRTPTRCRRSAASKSHPRRRRGSTPPDRPGRRHRRCGCGRQSRRRVQALADGAGAAIRARPGLPRRAGRDPVRASDQRQGRARNRATAMRHLATRWALRAAARPSPPGDRGRSGPAGVSGPTGAGGCRADGVAAPESR